MSDPINKPKFYSFYQNNSGGHFDHDPRSGIGFTVVVEANSAEEAIYRAKDIGLYFDGVSKGEDCPCCGDRWYAPYDDDDDAYDVPSHYGIPLILDETGGTRWNLPAYVHYLNGDVVTATFYKGI